MFGSPKLLVGFTFATAVVVGGVIALATGAWWALALAVGLHAIGTTLVLRGTFGRIDQQDKPDPFTEARLEDRRHGGTFAQ